MNIDIEGEDLAVLQAIDFSRFSPLVIAVEIAVDVWTTMEFQRFLGRIGYKVMAAAGPTLILKRMTDLP